MKKAIQKLTTAASLFAMITGNAVAKNNDTTQFESVQESVNMVHSLVTKVDDKSVKELFDKVLLLSQKINQLNARLVQDKFKITPMEFRILSVIRDLLDLNSTILVDKHEERIMNEFRTQYRAYTNSIVELDHSIARVKEKLNLVQVVSVDDLDISATELAEINQAAKERAAR